jgi:hypothetical protein
MCLRGKYFIRYNRETTILPLSHGLFFSCHQFFPLCQCRILQIHEVSLNEITTPDPELI